MAKPTVNESRLIIGTQYFIASHNLCEGMKQSRGKNNLHLLVTLRSFIEYSRRGIWFMAWATEKKVHDAKRLTFNRSGSPNLVTMDEMINEALGLGRRSGLTAKVVGMNESTVNLLHALTHGNPISVRMLQFGLDKIFQIDFFLARVEMECDMFAVILCRRALRHDFATIWKDLTPIRDRPVDMRVALNHVAPLARPALDKMSEKFRQSEISPVMPISPPA
jgi:hypothetical protein